jgi:hypothetical protein
MEPDRYEINHKLYIFGVICLIMALTLFFFSLYIAPFLIWQLNYNVPYIITSLINTFEESYEFSPGGSKTLVWLLFFIPSLVTGFISYYISNFIDSKIYSMETKKNEEDDSTTSPEVKKELMESLNVGFKIIFYIVVIVGIFLLLNAFIK